MFSDADRACLVDSCKALIESRFVVGSEHGAAAILTSDGSVLTGTSPDYPNSAGVVCHETEPFCAAHRLDVAIVASVCLHRRASGELIVLSPCGVCRERLAIHGPDVLVAVSGSPATEIEWAPMGKRLPHYWLSAFPEDVPNWTV